VKNFGLPLKLNLGCGGDKHPGYVNIDALAQFAPDLQLDLLDNWPFAPGSVSEILAFDILEHFLEPDLEKVLAKISFVLKTGGLLRIRVPNLDDIISRFASDPDTRNLFIYGNTQDTGIFGLHKMAFTRHQLISLLAWHNLQLLNIKQENTNWLASFKKVNSRPQLKNVAIFVQTFGLGGAETFWTDLLKQMVNDKWLMVNQIHIFTNHLPFIKLLESKKLTVTKINSELDLVGDWKGLAKACILWPAFMAEYTKIFFNLKKQNKLDLILVSGLVEKIYLSILGKIFQVPIVWLEFGPVAPLLNKFAKFPKFLYYLVKKIPEYIIVPSQHTKRHLITGAHVVESKIKVIPCGRKVEKFRNYKLGIKNYRIVCVSRLEPGKGQDLLIKAMSQVWKKIPQVKLEIIGEGNWSLKTNSKILLRGRVVDAVQEMAKADLIVFPSVWELEGFGLVAIEAMALGKPIVAFDRPPINEILQSEKNALLAKNKDVPDLARQIIKLLSHKTLATQLGKQARADFAQKYDISKVAPLYQEIWERAYGSTRAKKLFLHSTPLWCYKNRSQNRF